MEHTITIRVSIPDPLLAAINAIGALGEVRQELGLQMAGASPEPAPLPAAPAHTMDELKGVAQRCAMDPSKRDASRQIVKDAGLSKLSDAGPERIDDLYAAFTELLNSADHA